MFHSAFIEAFNVEKDKVNFREFMLSEEMLRKVEETKHSMAEEELFKKMAQSICPEIFGME
jgi:DNA replicative helicase MCM subunit Mcm2 (Cdc46/Mcm family)